MKVAGPEPPPCETTNPEEPLKTCPEGNPGVLTVSATLDTSLAPVTVYRVDVLVPWLETQNGLVALKETPQGLTKRGSVMVARPAATGATNASPRAVSLNVFRFIYGSWRYMSNWHARRHRVKKTRMLTDGGSVAR
jgi:hypothetical protein